MSNLTPLEERELDKYLISWSHENTYRLDPHANGITYMYGNDSTMPLIVSIAFRYDYLLVKDIILKKNYDLLNQGFMTLGTYRQNYNKGQIYLDPNYTTAVVTVVVASGGSGYAVGDVLNVLGGFGSGCQITVATLNSGTTSVATVTVSSGGSEYILQNGLYTSKVTGNGSGCIVNITGLYNSQYSIDYYDAVKISPENANPRAGYETAESRSGPDNFRTVLDLSKVKNVRRYSEYRLYLTQYCHYLSIILKEIWVKYSRTGRLTELEQAYSDLCFTTLLQYTITHWLYYMTPWGWGDPHVNTKHRCEAILKSICNEKNLAVCSSLSDIPDYTFPYLSTRGYMRAWWDTDEHALAIACNLLYLINNYSNEFNSINFPTLTVSNKNVLLDMRLRNLQSYQILLSEDDDFVFFPGCYYQHPDFGYETYTGATYPLDTNPVTAKYYYPQIAGDFSHDRRHSLFLENLRDSYINDSSDTNHTNYNYVESLLVRMASQFASICTYVNDVPLFANFWDGLNGWYRVGYLGRNYGYSPYTLSKGVFQHHYIRLIPKSLNVKTIYQNLYSSLLSSNTNTIDTRTRYYGTGSSGRKDTQGSVDAFGTEEKLKSSIFYCNWLCAKKLGWLN